MVVIAYHGDEREIDNDRKLSRENRGKRDRSKCIERTFVNKNKNKLYNLFEKLLAS